MCSQSQLLGERKETERERKRVEFAPDFRKIWMKVKACQPVETDKLRATIWWPDQCQLPQGPGPHTKESLVWKKFKGHYHAKC